MGLTDMGDPEKIWAVFEDHVNRKDMRPYVYASAAPTKAKPFISESLAQAMVAAAYEVSGDRAADEYDAQDLLSGANLAGYIRALTPTDARAALEARDKRVREDALREAAAIIPNVIQSYGMMKPGKPDQYASREAQIVAKGFARLIEEDILSLIDRTAEGTDL